MFKYNFALMQHHKWSYYDLEHMMPWERDIYLELLHQWIKDEEERQKELDRLTKIVKEGNNMKADLKKWAMERKRILKNSLFSDEL